MDQVHTRESSAKIYYQPKADNKTFFKPYECCDPYRSDIEDFITNTYLDVFGARLNGFLSVLVAGQRTGEPVSMAFGLTPAVDSPLFLENYLAESIEDILSRATGSDIDRSEIVELGNLALSDRRDLNSAFQGMAQFCHDQGYRYVVCTATRILRLIFINAGISPMYLADVCFNDVVRDGTHWGNYYRYSPQIVVGDVRNCLNQLTIGEMINVAT
jgi:hypothetical protein